MNPCSASLLENGTCTSLMGKYYIYSFAACIPTRIQFQRGWNLQSAYFPSNKRARAQQYVHTAFINMHCARALSAVAGLQLPCKKLPGRIE